MSSSIDRALLALSLDEQNESFNMQDLPEYCSSENNVFSIIGRVLNPSSQKIANLILDMPRKWRLYDRVRGIALSPEKFQFFFKYEQDLEAILEKGVHTYNEWTLVIERWVEHPSPDYLQHILVWVQLRNIPVNHYNVPAITWLGELVGQVKEVGLDTSKSQRQDFVRVKLKFDVSKPLQRSKVVNLPKKAGAVTILYDFERVQKRCFACQRLTHDHLACHVALKRNQMKEEEDKLHRLGVEIPKKKLIMESDPLFGVVEDHQIEICSINGKPKIDKTVVEGMRQYLLMAEGAERLARADRIRSSLEALKNDPLGQKTMLRLESAPLVSTDLNKEKGIVFNYGDKAVSSDTELKALKSGNVLGDVMAGGSSIKTHDGVSLRPKGVFKRLGTSKVKDGYDNQSSSTVQRTSIFQAISSGTTLIKNYKRSRPYKNQRKNLVSRINAGSENKVEDIEGMSSKRKRVDEADPPSKVARRTNNEMVPNEGLSNV
ncbi:hypothetical protein V5N11_016975 [Cardamine amara subsp. amara]|uniref:DUF4283 domain-containing protein n=1 Tax=Cardamine amara subsp. amara TaxID=228776 RepID=A0ABD1B8D3_CARAN